MKAELRQLLNVLCPSKNYMHAVLSSFGSAELCLGGLERDNETCSLFSRHTLLTREIAKNYDLISMLEY